MECYLDNAATTCCRKEVVEIMNQVMLCDYGNPSSLHKKGMDAEAYIKQGKEQIAKVLKVKEKELYFTSGGTEADNLAIIGGALANKRNGNHLITSAIEHPAVLEAMDYLKEQGFEITYLPVNKMGRIESSQLKQALREDTILVSIMHTNNEIGSIQPIAELGEIIKEYNPSILFHVDAVQGFGKSKIYPKKMNIDLLSVSGHKIHGPKGSGFLYISEKTKVKPLLFGGGQQLGIRPGTENVPAIAGLMVAVTQIYQDMDTCLNNLCYLKERLATGLLEIEQVFLNGYDPQNDAVHILSVSILGIRSEVLLHALEERGIYVSSGSACASNKPAHSKTLKALGLPKDLLESTLRFSFSVFTKQEDIDYTLQVMKELVPSLRRFTRV